MSSRSPRSQDVAGTTPSDALRAVHPVRMIIGDMADTAWRMFIPTIGATVLGIWIDKQLHTTPWVMIVLMLLGTALAIVLVRRQLLRVKQEK